MLEQKKRCKNSLNLQDLSASDIHNLKIFTKKAKEELRATQRRLWQTVYDLDRRTQQARDFAQRGSNDRQRSS